MATQSAGIPGPEPYQATFDVYSSSDAIRYSPESALSAGKQMVSALQSTFKGLLKIGTPVVRTHMQRCFERSMSVQLPKTIIGVVGATGVGKSSTINALLDAQIVPTSGVSACTAVVTEISYHNKPTIEADIEFISDIEWQNDVADLKNELEGQIFERGKKPSLPNSNVPWAKVRAVYPSLELSQVPHRSVDEIIESRPDVRKLLGTTHHISAENPEEFAVQFSQYVSNMPHARPNVAKGRGKGKGKGKASAPDQATPVTSLKTLSFRDLESIRKRRALVKQEPRLEEIPDGQDVEDAPDTVMSEGALWPLVGKVRIHCNAPVLSTGAILVDLPGMMDDNAARNGIANAYLGKCHKIWLVAKIQRAVNDQLAKKLLGDHMNRQMRMDSNLSGRTITFIATHTDDISATEIANSLSLHEDPSYQELRARLSSCRLQAQGLEDKLAENTHGRREVREAVEVLQTDLAALRQQLAGSASTDSEDDGADASAGHKRPRADQEPLSPQRVKHVKKEEHDGDIPLTAGPSGSITDEGNDGARTILEGKIEEVERDLWMANEVVNEFEKYIAEDKVAILAQRAEESEAQRALSAYASLKRSEYARREMKNDFRLGLDELQGHSSRDMPSADLPVFCCSARDYVRLTGQISGDGKPSCFSNIKETEIPALQAWCIEVTEPARREIAERYLLELNAIADIVRGYVSVVDRTINPSYTALKLKWQSAEDVIDVDAVMNGAGSEIDELEEIVGIRRNLERSFVAAVAHSVGDLKGRLAGALEDVCTSSAREASSKAPEFVETLSSSMKWNTYRATLRRHGSWHRDINEEMTNPILRGIADSWAETFNGNLFQALGERIDAASLALFQALEESAAPDIRKQVVLQIQSALNNVFWRVRHAVSAAESAITKEQKETSRSLVPFVQQGLVEGYDRSMQDRGVGAGSARREQAIFRQYVQDNHEKLFEDAAGMLVGRLVSAVNTVGEDLMRQVREFANNVEIEMSTLWAGVHEGQSEIRARMATTAAVTEVTRQIRFWQEAQARPPVSRVELAVETT